MRYLASRQFGALAVCAFVHRTGNPVVHSVILCDTNAPIRHIVPAQSPEPKNQCCLDTRDRPQGRILWLIRNSGQSYSYPIATTREIESQLIDILERIEKTKGPQIFFVFDELDKIDVPYKAGNEFQPEFSNERYLSGGGTSRKRKTTVLHLLGNLKYFTSTAKAKFIFIAGREMYDAYLADMTDRESAISSLFNGIIYVDSFCKNEKSEKDVLYNAETFIVRQLVPHSYIEKKVLDRYIECKLTDEIYTNIDINLKLYYEYLTTSYSSVLLKDKDKDKEDCTTKNNDDPVQTFNEVRDAIDKVIILLYHLHSISTTSVTAPRKRCGSISRTSSVP